MPFSRHVTLAANTVTPVTSPTNYSRVMVINRDGVAEVYFTTDGTTTPSAGGDNTFVVPSSICALEVADESSGTSTTVKLISPGTPKVTVRFT